MKTCPHCSKTYPDDDLFCHVDGNSLVNEDGEQPTLINQKRIVMSPFGAQADSGPAPDYKETEEFQPHVFTPPDSRTEPVGSSNNGIIAAVAGVCVVLVVLLFALFGLGGGGGSKNNNTNPEKTPEPKPTLRKSFNYVYSGSYTNKDISLTLTLNRDGDKMTGTAETGVAGTAAKTDTLDGTIDENGDFKLYGKENGINYTGIYTGHIDTGDQINGQWTPKDGGKSSTFTVSRSGK